MLARRASTLLPRFTLRRNNPKQPLENTFYGFQRAAREVGLQNALMIQPFFDIALLIIIPWIVEFRFSIVLRRDE
jgi:hypothetical protein